MKVNRELNYLLDEQIKVLKSIKRPFGSFKKATYRLIKNRQCYYFFTTTIHTEDEAISLLVDIANSKYYFKYYSITKRQNGVNSLLYQVPKLAMKLTKEDKSFVRENYIDFSDEELSQKLSVNIYAIKFFRKVHKLSREKFDIYD